MRSGTSPAILSSPEPAQRTRRSSPRVAIPLGTGRLSGGSEYKLFWNSHETVNGHTLLVGGTGAGKTYQLTRFATALGLGGIRTLVVDVHGDIHPDCPTSTVLFSESTEFGLNPLAVSPDPHHGGVRKRANSFIALLARQMALGDKQKSALYRLLVDLYRSYGFEVDKPDTWSLDVDPRPWAKSRKRHPTLRDLTRHVENKLKAMRWGLSGQALVQFQEVQKLQRKLLALRVQDRQGHDVLDKLEKAKAAAVDAYAEALDKMERGDELDELLGWETPDAIKGLWDRLCSLEASGIFRGRAPAFDPGCPVWRYDISPLSRAEQQFFVQCLAEQQFYDAKERGEAEGPDLALIIDEAVNHVDDDDDHIVNVLLREVRKFGVMVVLAAQELGTFPKPVLSSTATKLLLGIDATEQKAVERRLGLEDGKLRCINPQLTALVQVQRRGAKVPQQGYVDVNVIS